MNLLLQIKKIFLSILAFACLCGILGAAAVVGLFYWAAQDLPDIDPIANFTPPQATIVLARDGSPLGSLFHEKRHMVPLDEMSPYIPMAFLAAEDDSFYEHPGINPIAIARAALVNFQSGRTTQGGSTITQQVVKQILLTPERSYKRKIKEAILAYRLEGEVSKDDILTIYLNQIFLGQAAYGVEAASRTFFGKHATDITLAESALLAGLPQAPSNYNPFRYPEAAKERQMYVLGRLLELQWVTQEQYDEAVAEPLVYWTMPESQMGAAGWYMEEVRRLLIAFFSEENMEILNIESDKFGADYVYEAGLTVTTAMDPIHQEAAALGLRKALEELARRQGYRGPLENVPPDQVEAYLDKSNFSPYHIIAGKWTTGLVTEVTREGASVALGNGYVGYVDVSTMSWARELNPRVAAAWAASITDATEVLNVGDVIWLAQPNSLAKEVDGERIPASYDPSSVVPGEPIELALQQMPVAQGAIASIEPMTGDVVAMVGGYEFGASHFNRAVQSFRQPGSAFKPFVYSAAIDSGFTASSILPDDPFTYVDPTSGAIWQPSNYDRSFKGPIELHSALAQSRNVCTARLAEYMGAQNIINRAHSMGFESEFSPTLAISLGSTEVSPLNLAQAYTAFAYQGWAVRPRIITSIRDLEGRELYTQAPEHWQAISPQNAYIMSTILKRVVTSGTATRALVLNKPLAGKTGTTNDEHDAWFVGYTPYLVTSVYVGYDQKQPLGRLEQGGRTALPGFVEYRRHVEYLYPADDFVRPPGIMMVNGLAYRDNEPIAGTAVLYQEEEVTPWADGYVSPYGGANPFGTPSNAVPYGNPPVALPYGQTAPAMPATSEDFYRQIY